LYFQRCLKNTTSGNEQCIKVAVLKVGAIFVLRCQYHKRLARRADLKSICKGRVDFCFAAVREILSVCDEQPEDKQLTLYNRRLIEILSVLAGAYMRLDGERDMARPGSEFL
jgi:hypothetical protein